jgi:uncharacterized protein (TIGR02996 family)
VYHSARDVTDPLLEQIAAAPEDDTPRLVWADSVGGERGELVVIQCELARGGLRREDAIARRKREAELLEHNASAWTRELDGLATSPTFRRGFVERAAVEATVFADNGDALFAAAPLLREIEVEGLHAGESSQEILGRLERMLESPRFARLRGLRFDRVGRTYERDSDFNPYGFESVGSAVLRLLLETRSLAHLDALELRRCALGSKDLAALAASPHVANLVELGVPYQQVEDYVAVAGEGVRAILDSPHLQGLEALDVADLLGAAPWTSFGRSGREDNRRRALEQAKQDAALFAHPRILQLRSLGIAACRLVDESIDALATAPFTRLAKLDLSGNDIVGSDFERLGPAQAFAHLEELVFNGGGSYVFGVKTAAALGNAPGFPALEIVRLCNKRLEPAAARVLLASPLAQRLELIDLRRNKALDAVADELRAAFDGVLLLD